MKCLTTALLALAAVLVVSGCGSYSTGPDQVGLEINGAVVGPAERYVEEECINPGTGDYADVSSQFVYYPTSQRVYEFSGADGADGDAFRIVTTEGAELTVSGDIKFYLNTDCETLRQFHTEIGGRYGAWWESASNTEPAGWADVLRIYIRNPLQRALNEASAEYTWRDLHNDEATKTEWETTVEELALRYIADSAGQPYFRDIQATIQKPDLPQDLQEQIDRGEAIAQENRNQAARNTQTATELEGIQQIIDVLGPDGYLAYRQNQLTEQQNDLLRAAIESGNVTILPLPQGSDLVVNQAAPE